MDFGETVVDRIGEIMQPIRSGAINRDHVRGDLYDLVAADGSSRRSDDQVTLFKNGGGTNLVLMIASYAVEALKSLKINIAAGICRIAERMSALGRRIVSGGP
ncbi:hypothetical protein EQ718_14575 (plasmid) [Paracoccus versutus]|uniref:Ornithine cyclodeaminase n=1 Tax=Paracoccus versutus TaxID=34007 RepID=A0AAQ0KJ48_PARVE|nr:hypothetical protein [Paracoccus versutus]KGJ01697.1 hypothetical protein IT40_27005 [Paracoccus versutus]REG25905.1 ornithine cyclodeaminase [Paracoccus versutus]WEJ80133.1 hypothetical protein EQ718_14575 [Paracoccus versutus]